MLNLKKRIEEADVVLIEADRGRSLVALNRRTYQNKLEDFCTRTGMEPIVTAPRHDVEGLHRRINDLTAANLITPSHGRFLKNSDPSTPVMFGKAKTHKPGIPLRGIINCRDSLTYGLENWLASKLNKILAFYPRKLKNSKTVYDTLAAFSFPEGHDLYSWDIQDLYPSIVPSDVIDIVVSFNQQFPAPDSLDSGMLRDLLTFCLQPRGINVGSEFYMMSSGLAMGSPLSATLSNFQLWDMENRVLPMLGSDVSQYFRFADDILVVCSTESVECLHGHFNTYRPNTLSFIQTPRVQGWLPYLDMKIKINRFRKFLSDINIKPTATFNYLKYTSFGPASQKSGVVHTVLNRIINIASPQFRFSLYEFFKKKLMLNGYPPTLIKKIWVSINKPRLRPPRPKEWIKLPFVKDPKVRNNITRGMAGINLGVVYTGGKALKAVIPSLYPRVPAMEEKNVIYDIPLLAPSKAVYTGQTGRTLRKRISEHAADLSRGSPNSSLVAFCNASGSSPDFAGTRIVTRAASKRARLISENTARFLHYENAVSKTNPILLRPPLKNFVGIIASAYE